MDPDAVFERADVTREAGDLLPGGPDEPKWVAIDPETDCRGVGEFENAARTNLVYAVRAYHEDPETTAPFLSAGKQQTHEMRWRQTDDTSFTDYLQRVLPF